MTLVTCRWCGKRCRSLSLHLARAHQSKRVVRVVPRMTMPEKEIRRIAAGALRYTGNHSFWVTFKNGSKKNPDFIVTPFSKTRRVVECYGRYWHKDDNPCDLVELYRQIGIECLVLWDDEIKIRKDELKRFITQTNGIRTAVSA